MKNQIIFIHGGETFNTYEEYLEHLKNKEYDPYKEKYKKWKEALAEELGDDFEVLQPRMPSKYNAKYEEWKLWFEKVAEFAKDNVVLVGHSLGALFLAKYLSENNFPKKIKAIYLIAAPYDGANTDESLGDFKLQEDLSSIEEQSEKIFIYHSKDDFVVPFSESKKYADKLHKAEVRVFEDRNHFLQESFPELVESIKNL
ncbi:MAG: alpha/beta hydrolase [Candidatus Spechtbacterales bacterium]|nr:alpha/beta hydrolase [Candidatus Spechtbacterales bacterium]